MAEINANSDLTYQYLDDGLSNGINYYKLKLNDIDGTSEYSKVQSVSNYDAEKTAFELYPNIVTDKTTLKLIGAKLGRVEVNFINTNGQVLKTIHLKTDEHDTYQLDCADLQKGLHVVQLITEGGISKSMRLMKP
jgi:hypothetical protein